MKFPLGQVVATPGALELLAKTNERIEDFLSRHGNGDWGDLDASDKQFNDLAVTRGGRILSAYKTGFGEKFWIITEADRSATTFLLPEEY